MTTPITLWDRRAFLAGASLTMVSACIASPASGDAAVRSQIADLEAHVGGRIGVAAIDTGNGARLSHRGDERFAMCSTFKWILAAVVLAKVDRHEVTLGQLIPYGSSDLLSASPVTTAHIGDGALSVDALCEAAVEVSDNTAANLLLELIGGPTGLTTFLRAHGDRMTRLDRNELSLNANESHDERDTTTPNAMVTTMNRILVGSELSAAARNKIIGWLKNCRTGSRRIRAGLPADWIVGDKTGTGVNGAVNDVAIAWPPNRAPILLAVYLSESNRSPETLNTAHAKVATIVAREFS